MSKKFWIGFVVVFILTAILDVVAQRFILSGLYAQTPSLWRPEAEMKVWLFFVVYLFASFFFTLIWHWARKWGGLMEGLRYGFYVGALISIPMAYGSYGAMPIHYSLALAWFLVGMAEYLILGAALGLIYGKQQAG